MFRLEFQQIILLEIVRNFSLNFFVSDGNPPGAYIGIPLVFYEILPVVVFHAILYDVSAGVP